MDNVEQEVERLYKEHFGKLVASLLYSSSDINPETAEDIVHDSFSSAIVNWRTQGMPLNPAGWIYRVCRNNALNRIRKDKNIEKLSERFGTESVEIKFSESVLDDQQLKLLFACAHPDLSPKVQIVITLKYVINLRVEAIARVLGMTLDGVDKLLLRARQKIRDEKILLEEPHSAALQSRLSGVHKVLYLIFNEGYKSSWGKEILREELCEDALIMTRALINSTLGNSETAALYSLMLFNSARFKSRFGDSGELLDLQGQDRSLWNKELILLGSNFFNQSQGQFVSSYHLEAAIAFIHCQAKSFVSTDWRTISGIYEQLLKNNPNPFVELNYAIALYHAGSKDVAFEILNELLSHPFMHQYHLLNSALGKFYHLEGDDQLAKRYLGKAYEQAGFAKEKEFIQKMLDEITSTL